MTYWQFRQLCDQLAAEQLQAGTRFSIDPILALYEDLDTVAYVFGVHKRTVLRWKANGIDWRMADKLACRAGFNPVTLWGAEWDSAANGANATVDDDVWYAEWLAGTAAAA